MDKARSRSKLVSLSIFAVALCVALDVALPPSDVADSAPPQAAVATGSSAESGAHIVLEPDVARARESAERRAVTPGPASLAVVNEEQSAWAERYGCLSDRELSDAYAKLEQRCIDELVRVAESIEAGTAAADGSTDPVRLRARDRRHMAFVARVGSQGRTPREITLEPGTDAAYDAAEREFAWVRDSATRRGVAIARWQTDTVSFRVR